MSYKGSGSVSFCSVFCIFQLIGDDVLIFYTDRESVARHLEVSG